MDVIQGRRVGLVLFGLLCFMRYTTGLDLCSSGSATSDNILLHIATTKINQDGGRCVCRLQVARSGSISVFPLFQGSDKVIIDNCDSVLSVGGTPTIFCRDGTPHKSSGTPRHVDQGVTVDIVATSSGRNPGGLRGTLQIKPYSFLESLGISITCFEPNTNGTVTSQAPVTSTIPTTALPTSATTTPQPTTSTLKDSPTPDTQPVTSTSTLTESTTKASPSSFVWTTVSSTSTNGQSTSKTSAASSTSTSIPKSTTISQHSSTVSTYLPGSSQSPVFSSVSVPVSTASTQGQSSTQTTTRRGSTPRLDVDAPRLFPVAAVAGAIGGGVLLVIIVAVVIACLRKNKDKEHPLIEDGQSQNSATPYSKPVFGTSGQYMVEKEHIGVQDEKPMKEGKQFMNPKYEEQLTKFPSIELPASLDSSSRGVTSGQVDVYAVNNGYAAIQTAAPENVVSTGLM